MVTVAVLSADQRLSFQIHQWMKEMADTVMWQIHTDPAEFVSKIETEVAADLVAASKGGGEAVIDAEDIGSGKSAELTDAFIRLVIVDLELLHERKIEPVEWTRKLKQLMSERLRTDPANPSKFLFLAFEGGGFKVESLRDPIIDDLVLKPLDRSVFLQKIEIMTSDDPGIKPTYLFRQKALVPVEIGKDALIEEISEFAFAVRSSFALAPGVFASIHAAVLGANELSRVICRVYKTDPHPSLPNLFLVRFGFFGLRSEQMANIKKFMRERGPKTTPRAQVQHGPTVDPAVPFNRVAVVDMNNDIFGEIQSTLKDHFVGVNVTHYLSYARLLAAFKKLYKVPAPAAGAAPGVASPPLAPEPVAITPAVPASESASDDVTIPTAEPEDPTNLKAWTIDGSLTFNITAVELELLKFETSLSSGDLVLGKTRLEWLERPADLLSNLDKLDANELREMVDYAVAGGKGRAYLKMKNQLDKTFFIEAHSNLSRSADGEIGAQVQIEFKEISAEDYQTHAGETAAAEASPLLAADLMYDAIYIDVNLIRGDLQPWYDGLHEAYMKAGILTPGAPMPKIILLADERSKTRPENYRSKLISDFMYKPLDRKVVSFKSKEIIELIPRKEPEFPPFVKAELRAKLAKDAVTEEISEYGVSILHPTPFKPGSTIRFFSPLLGGGAEGVLAKCSFCEEKKGEKTVSYICNFIFFGTPDEILKRIRTWIREDYIHKKEGQGG